MKPDGREGGNVITSQTIANSYEQPEKAHNRFFLKVFAESSAQLTS
jgi:hypothetical protein